MSPVAVLTNKNRKVKSILKTLFQTLYPNRCLSCGEDTHSTAHFCGDCWQDAHFIAGLTCDACGTPLPGDIDESTAFCESCHNFPPAWKQGVAVAVYDGPIRRLVLALKHGDRLDIAVPAAAWMAQQAEPLITPETMVIPVPLHWRRLFMRRFNQAALLGQKLAQIHQLDFVPDGLKRIKATAMQKGMNREERFENQQDAIAINPRQALNLANRPVLLVDDVMTTGATLSACAEICLANKATYVNVIVLARVARDE